MIVPAGYIEGFVCSLATCDVKIWWYAHYQPTLVGNSFFLVIIDILALAQLFLGCKYPTGFTVSHQLSPLSPFLLCLFVEFSSWWFHFLVVSMHSTWTNFRIYRIYCLSFFFTQIHLVADTSWCTSSVLLSDPPLSLHQYIFALVALWWSIEKISVVFDLETIQYSSWGVTLSAWLFRLLVEELRPRIHWRTKRWSGFLDDLRERFDSWSTG